MALKNTKDVVDVGITVSKEKDFSEWYTQVVIKSGLADYSPVSGCIIFKPYAYAIWEKIRDVVDQRLKKMGVQNAYFPLLIPESLLMKEKEHIEGFSPEVAWVTHAGNSKLDQRLAVRPTSEAIMYEAYARWIRSWRDLPLRLNQWNSVIRWEFKHPIPFLRTREFLWNEGHTVFATQQEAEEEAMAILKMYDDVLREYLALHAVLGRKTDKEKFAGAVYTLSAELFMPNGKAIQGPDSHHDGQKFAKAFGITFLDREEKQQYAWQNTWAITTRMIGVLVAVHGDDKGLVLPPRLAPHRVVIVPILIKGKEKGVSEMAQRIQHVLRHHDALVDDRDYNPGWKFNEWEMKGVPLRLEIGPQEVSKGQVVLVRRDTGEKKTVREQDLEKTVNVLLEEIHIGLLTKSRDILEKNVVQASTMSDLAKALQNKKFAQVFWCGQQTCEERVKTENDSAKILHIPFDQPKMMRTCIVCQQKGKHRVYVARSY